MIKEYLARDSSLNKLYNAYLISVDNSDSAMSEVLEFISNYRAKYATDPSDFSFIGFDAAFINLKGILLYGTGFSSHYEHLTNTGFSTNSLFEKVDPQGGYENKNVFIIRYEDYSVIKE